MGEKIILFGPPASGKSTLIQLAAQRPRTTAIELERVERQHRKPLLDKLAEIDFRGPLFTAAVDVRFDDIPQPFKIVFLFPDDKAAYLQHVEERNRQVESKVGQKEEETYDMMKLHIRQNSRVNLEIDRTGRTAEDVLDEICRKLLTA